MQNASWITVNAPDFEDPTDHRVIRLDSCNYVNMYVQLIYGGEIIHDNTVCCGYYGAGWLDHGSYPMMSNGQGDFIRNLSVVGDGEVSGFRID